LLGECSADPDGLAYLCEVGGAAVTFREVEVEATPVGLGQGSFEIISDETHELSACELIGPVGSLAESWDSHGVLK
jgi:hypothetical protein